MWFGCGFSEDAPLQLRGRVTHFITIRKDNIRRNPSFDLNASSDVQAHTTVQYAGANRGMPPLRWFAECGAGASVGQTRIFKEGKLYVHTSVLRGIYLIPRVFGIFCDQSVIQLVDRHKLRMVLGGFLKLSLYLLIRTKLTTAGKKAVFLECGFSSHS